jgi:hypothetical protein
MLTDAQPLRYLRNWLAPIRDLSHNGTLEIIVELNFAHHGLPALKIREEGV